MLLSVDHLTVGFGQGPIVQDASFALAPGGTMGLVGASGSGKSVTCHAIARLLPDAADVTGRITFDGCDLLSLTARQMRPLRGGRIAMIFQNPTRALNPVHKIGRQMTEVLWLHRRLTGRAARNEAVAQLETVGIPDAARRLAAYPHELSGGMCQRVMIAMALAAQPDLLIADEPTTALDVTTQAQILHLLRQLQAEHGTALLLVTHDMGVIAEMVETVVVLDQGQVIEAGATRDIFTAPSREVTRKIVSEARSFPLPTLAPPPLLKAGP
ncbi:ATP-binding cassette domain-containing protein [Pontivivens ytuae]|uniref:ABC transporter ATP-binding protein n=1 Tax=Pontivivens ytuae TaxID=2789856 RepID=A0A7S9QDJ2_9RHOB|nr:ABC transporter ATP-binding protein [Pontivivens ytuae]QPH54950.1 ABC transporter ATP-binding protein [Pontivivens ytuae]